MIKISSFSLGLCCFLPGLFFSEKSLTLGNELLLWMVVWQWNLSFWALHSASAFSAEVSLPLEVALWDRTQKSHFGSFSSNGPHLIHKEWWHSLCKGWELKQSHCSAHLTRPPHREVAYQVVPSKTPSLSLEISMSQNFPQSKASKKPPHQISSSFHCL